MMLVFFLMLICFNPRTYIRYDCPLFPRYTAPSGFNPRTYIRYDGIHRLRHHAGKVSIHVPI